MRRDGKCTSFNGPIPLSNGLVSKDLDNTTDDPRQDWAEGATGWSGPCAP